MDSLIDVLRNHPNFDPIKGTDIPSIEEIYAVNVMTYEQARLIQERDAEASKARRNETEGERMAREADLLRSRLRMAGVPERFLSAPAYMTVDLSDGNGAYLFGKQGSGKTTRAAGILKGWMSKTSGAAKFIASADMLTEIGATYSSYETEESVILKYGRAKVLVIDDLGKENPTDQALTKLWQVIDMRYRDMLPTIVTTQHNFGELVAELGRRGGIETAKAIVSRLYETCAPINMGNVDHRRK